MASDGLIEGTWSANISPTTNTRTSYSSAQPCHSCSCKHPIHERSRFVPTPPLNLTLHLLVPNNLQDALPDFTGVSHIFLPINDNNNPNTPEGGSHWSLLLVSIVDGVAFHYDSFPPGNESEAHYSTQKLSRLLNRPLRFINLTDSPMQDNLSDCGVFVCLNMRHLLLKRLLMVRTDNKVSMSLGGRAVDAAAGRKEMLKIIDEFRREGERRRSISHSPHPGRKSRSPPRIDSPGANRSKSPRFG